MKLVYERGPGFISVHKEYEPGEKYISSLIWRPKEHGYADQASVERRVPGGRFRGIKHYTGFCPETFNPKSWMTVLVERVAQ